MKICPQCKAEYREGFDICSDCNVQLVNKVEEEKVEKLEKEYREVNWVYLTNVSHDMLYIYLSLLDSNEIPVITKDREAGGYLKISTGINTFGTDIFVPEENLEDGKNIIGDIKTKEVKEVEYDEESNCHEFDHDKFIRKGKRVRYGLLGIAFLPAIIILLLKLFLR